jgi:CheY-like chemotaxis protein
MNPIQDPVLRETIKLRAFVRTVLTDFEASARARYVTLDGLVFSEELEADAELLRRLLEYLVGYALRRAPAGTNVSLVVSPLGRHTEFRVADEGGGILLDAGGAIAGSELAFCRTAAEERGGWLTVLETNEGAIVCLALPDEVEATRVSGPSNVTQRRLPSDSGIYQRASQAEVRPTLLIVEDEPLVRSFVARALRSEGYGVLEADSAERALEILKAKPQPISLVLSDVGLPGASGAELVQHARRLMPELPTLLMSASGDAELSRRGVPRGSYVLQKPFTIAELIGKLQELLMPTSRPMTVQKKEDARNR